jgi:multiple sugar transport system ATP-binding protein
MAEIVLSNTVKCYTKGVPVVRNFSLEIHDKEFIVLLGPSGCGKTTVLRMIAGLEEITEGDIYIDAKLVNDMAPRDRDLAMVFQNYAIYPHLTVYGNIAFSLKARDFAKSEIDERVRSTAKILGIDQYLERKPRHLSGGERQRVALGRAIVRKPKAFLMDEPLSNLDAQLRVHMRFELGQLHRKLGVTTVYVTHDQIEALTLGDRIVLMNAGEIQQIADPFTIYNRPANIFVASFLGSPSMNFFDAKVVREDGIFYLDAESFRLRLTPNITGLADYIGKDVIFGFRPEAIALSEYTRFQNKSENIKVRIDDVEPVGDNELIYVSCGKRLFIANKEASTGVLDRQDVIGKEAKINFNLDRVHIFDKASEQAIYNP